MVIVSIEPSKKSNKRYRVKMDDDRVFDFGYKHGTTYIDHADKKLRNAYWKRHYKNKTEKQLIDNLIPSPALFSAYLLWGASTDILQNINHLNNLWMKKHQK